MLTGMLLMDMEGAFNHVSRNSLPQTMNDIGGDGDLMGWTDSLMSDTSDRLIIDRHLSVETTVETLVPQESPVLVILFAIYLSRVFKDVEAEVEGYMATSFAEDWYQSLTKDSVEELYKRLERARIRSVEWRRKKLLKIVVQVTFLDVIHLAF